MNGYEHQRSNTRQKLLLIIMSCSYVISPLGLYRTAVDLRARRTIIFLSYNHMIRNSIDMHTCRIAQNQYLLCYKMTSYDFVESYKCIHGRRFDGRQQLVGHVTRPLRACDDQVLHSGEYGTAVRWQATHSYRAVCSCRTTVLTPRISVEVVEFTLDNVFAVAMYFLLLLEEGRNESIVAADCAYHVCRRAMRDRGKTESLS